MFVIGLTGGIASGKTTVSRILKELGAEVIDADQVARKVTEPNRPAWNELVRAFGKGILNPDCTINRRRLGSLVFGNPKHLATLNSITHPRIIADIKDRLELLAAESEGRVKEGTETELAGNKEKVVVLDAPLLIEAGMTSLVDEVWVVVVGRETQISRLMARENFSYEEAVQRLRAQMPLSEKVKRADRVIDNEGLLEETRRKVQALWKEIQQQAKMRKGKAEGKD